MNNPGWLRKALIVLILIISISSAFLYFAFNKGLYKAPEIEYSSIFIENALVFTGLNREIKQENILIRGEDIACMGKDCEKPEGAIFIDATDLAVMPALSDLGVQFYRISGENRGLSSFEQFISFTRQRPEVRKNFHRAGISNIRSVGDAPQNILVLKEQIESSKLLGPRIYAAGLMITAPGGHPIATEYKGNEFMLNNGVRILQNSKEIPALLADLAGQKIDGLKIVYRSYGGKYPILQTDLLEKLIEAGKEKGFWISVLTGSNQEVRDAVLAGAESIEFGTEESLDSSLVALIKEKESLYIPMLSSLEADEQALSRQMENVRKLIEAGAQIGVASDNPPYQRFGISLQRELELLAQADMPPSEILKMASLGAAISLKADDRWGSLEEGKLADILICEGKPWENISDIKKVQYLIQEGSLIMQKGALVED
ncbi:MAG: amidohydrolase family protein [Bacteroidota bacterium]